MKIKNFLSLLFILTLFCGCSRSAYKKEQKNLTEKISLIEPVYKEDLPFKKITPNTLKKNSKTTSKVIIVLDAGHGGEDFGTHSLGKIKYQEKNLNLSTTLLVKKILEQYGYQVLMTRKTDTFISLENRAHFANTQNSKLFVSIHYNSAPSQDAEGLEVFYYRDEANKKRTTQSKLLAQAIHDRTIQNTHAKSRGVKIGNYSVIRETEMPAILIEGGFLTHTKEMEKIKDPRYMKNIALGIAQGIQDYLKKEDVS